MRVLRLAPILLACRLARSSRACRPRRGRRSCRVCRSHRAHRACRACRACRASGFARWTRRVAWLVLIACSPAVAADNKAASKPDARSREAERQCLQALESLAGGWRFVAERSASGGAAAAAWKGEAIRSPLAAGRFLIEASQDEATRYEGFWLLGWDRQSSSCELVWLDAVSGALVRMRGRLDPSAGLFSFSGEGPAPGTGAPRKLRAGFRIGGGEGEDAQVLEVFEVVGTKARRLFRASYSPTAERDAPGGETPSGPFADAASAVKEAEAMQQVAMLSRALELYLMDERGLPGEGLPADASRNDFPRLFDALLGEPRPKGPGGRSSPYLPFGAANVRVWDEGKKAYRAARPAELKDPKVSKYILDPWGRPYVYRANKGKKAERWMRNAEGADIYSLGPNGKDDTAAGASGGDDIGNW